MNARGFQALVSQLGELSAVQREALISALKRRLPLTTRISDEARHRILRRFSKRIIARLEPPGTFHTARVKTPSKAFDDRLTR
jgi:hypothetical protein